MSAPAGFSLRLGLQSFIQRLVSVSHLGQRWTASYRFSASEGCNEMRGITTWQFGHVTRPIGRRFEPSRSLWGWTSTASGMASSRSPTARQEQPNCSLKAASVPPPVTLRALFVVILLVVVLFLFVFLSFL
jgi:hypothetical protein